MGKRISFTKMHGLGNDFIVLRADDMGLPEAATIRRLANRHTGIGFDQLLWLEPPKDPPADIFYRVFNADGTEAGQCGNGARCIARFLGDELHRPLLLQHPAGTVEARIGANGFVSVDMGIPQFAPGRVPFIAPDHPPPYQLDVDGGGVEVRVVSLGNPHAVLQVDDIAAAPVTELGPLLESHDRFPNRANIGFVHKVGPGRIRLRVYERGTGETQGCGTGACAAVVTGIQSGQLANRVTVELPGGTLEVRWDGPGTPVWLTGEAVIVFEGIIEV